MERANEHAKPKDVDIDVDVVIVGAGPAGLTLAIGLAMQGQDFVIVDALPEIQQMSRAAVVHAGTLEALEPLGVVSNMEEKGIRIDKFCVRDQEKVLFHASFTNLNSTKQFLLMIPQDETEAILVSRLTELGHHVRRSATVTEVKNQDKSAIVQLQDGTRIQAKYVVGADGEKSTVRRCAGIGFPGETYGSFLLADVRMDWPTTEDEVTLFFSMGGVLVVAPMSGRRYRVVAQLQNAPRSPSLREVQVVMDSRGPRSGVRIKEILWGSRFKVHHKLADRFWAGRCLLLGDAAHVHSPAGGQGMNLGLRDAVALSAALSEAIAKNSSEPLEHYAETRRAVAKEVLQMTHRLTAVATLKHWSLRVLRNHVIRFVSLFPFVRRTVANRLAGTMDKASKNC